MPTKSVALQVDLTYGTASLHSALSGAISSPWMVDPGAMTILVGLLTAPPRYTGLSLSNFWAHLRYMPAISTSHPELRLRKLWADVDSHQKTIMSDDFGMSAPALYMIEHLEIEKLVDTRWFAANISPTILRKIPKKKGPSKAADFVCTDRHGNYHLLECKGTQASVSALKGAIAKGIGQKGVPSSAASFFSSRMVGGLFLPQHASPEQPCLIFADPPEPEYFTALMGCERAVLDRRHRRVWFAKLLAAAGLWRMATSVFDGFSTSEDRDFLSRTSGELNFSGFEQGASEFVLRIEHRSFDDVDGRDIPVRNLLEIRMESGVFNELAGFAREGGLGSTGFDDWLASLSDGSVPTDGKVGAASQGTSSIAIVSAPTFSEINTSFGLSFRLSSLPYT